MAFVSVIYGMGFIFMAFVLLRAVKRTPSVFEDAFYMLFSFSLCKGASALIGLRPGGVISAGMQFEPWLQDAATNLSGMFSVVANVFLFQAALDFLLYKLPTKLKLRVVPLFIFSGYLLLYVSNIIEPSEVDKIGRFSFGYHSAILTAIAMLNLFYIVKRSAGIIIAGFGFIMYAVFEGIILSGQVLGMDIALVRLICMLLLIAGSFSMRSLLAVEKKPLSKIAYI